MSEFAYFFYLFPKMLLLNISDALLPKSDEFPNFIYPNTGCEVLKIFWSPWLSEFFWLSEFLPLSLPFDELLLDRLEKFPKIEDWLLILNELEPKIEF